MKSIRKEYKVRVSLPTFDRSSDGRGTVRRIYPAIAQYNGEIAQYGGALMDLRIDGLTVGTATRTEVNRAVLTGKIIRLNPKTIHRDPRAPRDPKMPSELKELLYPNPHNVTVRVSDRVIYSITSNVDFDYCKAFNAVVDARKNGAVDIRIICNGTRIGMRDFLAKVKAQREQRMRDGSKIGF